MRAKKQNSETRRRQIARAALALIARQGMKGLSLTAIARKVGLVPSALYRHFKGKEEILGATLELIQDLIMENIHTVRQESTSPLEQLKLLMMRHMEMIQEFQAIPRIVFSDEISSSYPQGRNAVYKIIREILGQLADTIERGQRRGQIKPTLNPDAVSVICLGLVQPPAILWYLSKGKFDILKHMEKAWPIFEKAVRVETPVAVSSKKRASKKPQKK